MLKASLGVIQSRQPSKYVIPQPGIAWPFAECWRQPVRADTDYQTRLAARGAFIEYDMIGMDYYYADQQVQCPSDEEAAIGISRLAEAGHIDRVLLSQDVFLKMMLSRYGGNGYAFVQRHFLPRLRRHGFDDRSIDTLTRHNPRRVFDITLQA